ncbi:hypothetical protein [Klebsiella michiganensis]|uniref:hypothetical protein n=1 Tax=Klebsiella michiganensis TaxID=1134687 RepID=UPI003D95A8A4
MKRFKSMWFLILCICSFYVHANDDLDVTNCSLRESSSCEILIKMKQNGDGLSYKVELVDAENEKKYSLILI